jgi:mRNA-degrading endonuclease RelE of RelBE toxin-antitoxin system
VAGRLRDALRRYAQSGQGDVRPLQGQPDFRLRVGDWRNRFRFDSESHTLIILRVLPRGRAYRD